jgi:hypothetical protein
MALCIHLMVPNTNKATMTVVNNMNVIVNRAVHSEDLLFDWHLRAAKCYPAHGLKSLMQSLVATACAKYKQPYCNSTKGHDKMS